MSDSDWRKKFDFGIVLAACSLLIIIPITGLMLAEYAKVHSANAAYEKNAESERKTTSKEISNSCFKPDFSAFSECITEKVATYYKQQTTNQDLQAQQNMAYWAETVFFLGALQLVFSGAGIYFIWHSLELNRSAVRAAIEANKVARQIGKDQSRAYMIATMAELYGLGGHRIELKFENSGQTPARWFKVKSCVFVFDDVRSITFDNSREMEEVGPWQGIANNQNSFCSINQDQVTAIFIAMNNGGSPLFGLPDSGLPNILVQGVLTYETMYDEIISSEFMFYLNPPYPMMAKTIDNKLSETPWQFTKCSGALKSYHQEKP